MMTCHVIASNVVNPHDEIFDVFLERSTVLIP